MRGAEVIAPWMSSSDTAFWNLDRDGDGSLKQAEFVASRGNEKAVKKATELFAILDRDRDGRLTLQEFTKRPREARFHEEDTDGDGFLDAKEYVANRRGEAEIRRETDVFALLDQDHDGKLTFAESQASLPEVDHRRRDADGDGMLSWEEYSVGSRWPRRSGTSRTGTGTATGS
jgi:Ca2+-binding EF-hand superfamily protein